MRITTLLSASLALYAGESQAHCKWMRDACSRCAGEEGWWGERRHGLTARRRDADNFETLVVNGVKSEAYEYIRRYTNTLHPLRGTYTHKRRRIFEGDGGLMLTLLQWTDMASADMRCGTDGHKANGTKTLEVAAGHNVTWRADARVYHNGPLSVFMTKVEEAERADGSTPWFKVLDLGPTFSGRGADWKHVLKGEFVLSRARRIFWRKATWEADAVWR